MKGYPVLRILCHPQDVRDELEKIGVTSYGMTRMTPKGFFHTVKVFNVNIKAANILKQEMLSLGGEAAVSRGVIDYSVEETDVLLMGTQDHYHRLCDKLKIQPFGLRNLAKELSFKLKNAVECQQTIMSRGNVFPRKPKTIVMGIVNVTPDSFSDGGLFCDPVRAFDRAQQLRTEGADIIDIGGESTRPYSDPTSIEEEIGRVIPVIEALKKKTGIPISLDTYKSEVAGIGLEEGVDFINDVSGLRFDSNMAGLIAQHDAGIIIMHMKGSPKTMQGNPVYEDLMAEICNYLETGVKIALNAGVSMSNIVVDPGIGFGKTVSHNLHILKKLPELVSVGCPILVGTSRKSFIGHILNREGGERLEGTKATIVAAILNGASIIRIHDVKETMDVIKMADAIKYGCPGGN